MQSSLKGWVFSNKALFECIEAIKKKVKVDRSFDVPLLAGYSEDGKTLYFDIDMPEGYAGKNGYVHAINFLILHEGVEKALIDAYDLSYLPPHEVSQNVEWNAVKASGADVKEYGAFMDKWMKHARDKKKYKLPPDLDMKPYVKEKEIMAKINK